jgi:ribosomal protein L18E
MEMGVVWMPKRLIKRLKIIASYRDVPIWKVVEDLLNYTERSLFESLSNVSSVSSVSRNVSHVSRNFTEDKG